MNYSKLGVRDDGVIVRSDDPEATRLIDPATGGPYPVSVTTSGTIGKVGQATVTDSSDGLVVVGVEPDDGVPVLTGAEHLPELAEVIVTLLGDT